MKKLTVLIALSLIIGAAFAVLVPDIRAQDRYTWQNGERIGLETVHNQYVVQVADSLYSQIADISAIGEQNRYRLCDRKVIWITGKLAG